MQLFNNGAFFTVVASRKDVTNFKAQWPCSGLPTRSLRFEFHKQSGDLVDTNLPDGSDGSAAVALADDCKTYGIAKLTGR